MADTSAKGSDRKGGRAGGADAAGVAPRRTDASSAGMPNFVRPRHFARSANVFAVPLWELTARWLPEELASVKAVATAAAPTQAVVAGSSEQPPSTEACEPDAPQPQRRADARAESPSLDEADDDPSQGHAGDEAGSEGSDSEHSVVDWEGPLGGESRVWSRAEVDNGLFLLRKVQASAPRTSRVSARAAAADDKGEEGEAPAVPQSYGLAISAALFEPGVINEGGDARLDRRLAEVLRTREPRWAVCGLRSGHFAGAVFHGKEAVIHKAIHRYTIRAKSGGAQSAKDSGGSKAKSAGSNLRRYGEQRLAEEIQELMTDKWVSQLAGCELIFISVSKRMRPTLLGTDKAPYVPFHKVRKLPFMMGRPTFEAVKDAYHKVASIIFASEESTEALVAKFRPAPARTVKEPELKPAEQPSAAKAEAEAEAPSQPYREEEDEQYTELHAAAAAGAVELVVGMLDGGADPTRLDGKGRVPFWLAPNQRTRDAFRRWRGSNEDAWDWVAARVPDGITDESEQRKKDKEKEKKKKQKDKQKAAKAKQKEEEEAARLKEEEERKALEAAQAKCDSCGKPLLSKPFARLDYLYCSTECVTAHRRDLQAAAAMKRFST